MVGFSYAQKAGAARLNYESTPSHAAARVERHLCWYLSSVDPRNKKKEAKAQIKKYATVRTATNSEQEVDA